MIILISQVYPHTKFVLGRACTTLFITKSQTWCGGSPRWDARKSLLPTGDYFCASANLFSITPQLRFLKNASMYFPLPVAP